MRKFIVKHFALSYDSKVFGNNGRFPRATTLTISCFALAIIYTGFFEPMSAIEYLVWIPFIICIYLGFFYFKSKPISYAELEDWEQKYQYLNKPDNIGNSDETFPDDSFYRNALRKYAHYYLLKYKTEDNFVNAHRIVYTFAVIILTGILYSISQ